MTTTCRPIPPTASPPPMPSAAARFEVEKFPGEPHTFVSRDPNSAASRKALAMIVDFVRKHTGRA